MYPYVSEELSHLYQAERERDIAALVRGREAAQARSGRGGQGRRTTRLSTWAAAAAVLAGLLVGTSVVGTAAVPNQGSAPTQPAGSPATRAAVPVGALSDSDA